MSLDVGQLTQSKNFNQLTSRSGGRYTAKNQSPREVLKLGKALNLKKQNYRKRLLSMENQRICTQEDRVFNERIKMANLLGSQATKLPSV